MSPNGPTILIATPSYFFSYFLAIQAAYIRKVVDTVNEFDNVLYEVINLLPEHLSDGLLGDGHGFWDLVGELAASLG